MKKPCRVKLAGLSFSSVLFSPSADFHPAFVANAEISPNAFAASWAAALFNQAVLFPCLP
jgi:hypothetical protein